MIDMIQNQTITGIMFLIFTGTAILSTIALFTRQSLLIAYIALGAAFGPWGLKLISNATVINEAGDIGIIFLLFLLGLHLQPQNLFHSLRKMSLLTLISSVIFFIMGFAPSYFFHFSLQESAILGLAAMFSSTIIGLKLLPTTILHHQHTGELMISVLLLQDIIAIAVLLVLQGIGDRAFSFQDLGFIITSFPLLLFISYLFERFLLNKLLTNFDQIHEFIFILSIAWCLAMAELSRFMGLTEEIGAFIAGVALASNPISLYIAESLKPLRDFFLVIFFFTIGASFNFDYLPQVYIPAAILAAAILIAKPLIFSHLLYRTGEVKRISWEIGVRLGQMSEFSLLVTYMALSTNLLSPVSGYMLEAAIIISITASCYWTVMRYPTPLASTD